MTSRTCRLYIVRHGESEHNRAEKIGGQVDTKLTDRGRRQALRTKKALSKVKFDEVYGSTLSRAIETAALLFGGPVPMAHRLPDLRERTYGSLEEKPETHLNGWHDGLMALEPDDRWNYRHADGMETDAEVIERFLGAVEWIAKRNLGKIVLIVAHGGCIRATLVKLGFGKHEDLPPRSFKTAGYIELLYDGRGLTVGRVEGIDHELVERTKIERSKTKLL